MTVVRRLLSAAGLTAILSALLVAPMRADEEAAKPIEPDRAKTVTAWQSKTSAKSPGGWHAVAASEGQASKLKWRAYRKLSSALEAEHQQPSPILAQPARLAPQGPVRLIAGGPVQDRIALQPPGGTTPPDQLPTPPVGLRQPKADDSALPKSTLPDSLPPPPTTEPADNLPGELSQDLPDITPKDGLDPSDDPATKTSSAKESVPAVSRDNGAAQVNADKYRLSRIGDVKIDITPPPPAQGWNLRVDERGNLVVYQQPDLGIGGQDDQILSLQAVLVDVVDGQAKLLEIISNSTEQGATSVDTPAQGRLFSFPIDKLSDTDRKYVRRRFAKRVWTHRSGKYEMDGVFIRLRNASFLKLRGWVVDLRTDDGEIISLPLGDFVLQDQQFVREMWGLPLTIQQPQVEFARRDWAPINYTWAASALCHKPLYFEHVQLERYGHSLGPYLQPIASSAHFFLRVPALPYFMGVNPPNECVYALGYYRPGSCAPYLVPPLPISLRGAIYQGGVATGLAFLIP